MEQILKFIDGAPISQIKEIATQCLESLETDDFKDYLREYLVGRLNSSQDATYSDLVPDESDIDEACEEHNVTQFEDDENTE